MDLPDLSAYSHINLVPSLYVHIPFCRKKCNYCDFYSIHYDKESAADFLSGLEDQLRSFNYALNIDGYSSFYIGGGTPDVLSLDQFEAVLSLLDSYYTPGISGEWTVEMNPEGVTRDHLRVLSGYPVSRLSVGIQSFNEDSLELLGRNASASVNRRALDLIRSFWEGDTSIDLICGITGQDLKDLGSDIDIALGYRPDHLSLYTLSVEQGTPLGDAVDAGIGAAPDPDEQVDLWEEGIARLKSAGYTWYEISNFSFPGKESRHNIRYWEMRTYLGCGPGAVSTLVKKAEALRIQTDRRILPEFKLRAETVGRKAFLLEYLMMGLRMLRGFSKARFERTFSAAFDYYFGEEFRRFKNRGLMDENEEYIFVTPSGLRILNSLLLDFALRIEKLL